jgi:hypothetical protein
MSPAATMPSLDPSTWETPKEEFVGVIRVSRMGTTDDSKTKDGETFTEFFNLPRPATTFRLVVQRLDAVYKNKETEELSPILRFQDLQLERLNERTQKMEAVKQGDNKNTFILGKFPEAKLKLGTNPEQVEGAVCTFVREGTHKFGGNMAKNLLYPKKLLGWMKLDELKTERGQVYPAVDPFEAGIAGRIEFEYAGDVEEIEFDPARNETDGDGGTSGSTSLDQAASNVGSSSDNGKSSKKEEPKKAASMLDEDGVMALFVGKTVDDEDAATDIIAANKASIPQSMKASLVSGEALEGWLESGKLVIVDETYVLSESA